MTITPEAPKPRFERDWLNSVPHGEVMNHSVFMTPMMTPLSASPDGWKHCLIAAVLVRGHGPDDYAVYEAVIPHAYWEGSHGPWVAEHGSKLTFAQARRHFPNLPEDGYRR